MQRIFTVFAVFAMIAAPAMAFDPQPDPPKAVSCDGSVKTSTGSIKMGDGSVRVGVTR